MDPVEVREERVASGTAAAPVAPVAPAAAPVAGSGVYASRSAVYPVGYRFTQLVWLIAGIVNVVLALDFIFRLLSARREGFVDFIYSLAGPLAAPFDGIFGTTNVQGANVARWADIMAIVIYSLAAWAVVKIIRIALTRETAAPGPVV